MNRAQVIEGCAAAEVLPLDERHGKAALRRVVGDRQAVDAAADHEHVERPVGQRLEIARHPRHRTAMAWLL